MLLSLGLSENKQIGTLTERQRRLLALALMDRDPRPVATQRPPTHPLPPTDTEPRFHRAEALVGV